MAYEEALPSYRDALSTYTRWFDVDACVASILTSSVLPQFASEFMGLATVFGLWTCFCQCYQPSGDALYVCVVPQEHALQQGVSTIDDSFFF